MNKEGRIKNRKHEYEEILMNKKDVPKSSTQTIIEHKYGTQTRKMFQVSPSASIECNTRGIHRA